MHDSGWICSRTFSYFFLCQKKNLVENGLFILSQAIQIKFLGCHWLKYLIPNLCLASNFALALGVGCDPALLGWLQLQPEVSGPWAWRLAEQNKEGEGQLPETQGAKAWWIFAGTTQMLRAPGSAEMRCLCCEVAEQERSQDGMGSSGHSNKRSGHS